MPLGLFSKMPHLTLCNYLESLNLYNGRFFSRKLNLNINTGKVYSIFFNRKIIFKVW